MLIVTVLKLSQEYQLKQAIFIHRQLRQWGYEAICLSDAEYIPYVKTYPLRYNYPGWWSKMELFNPNHKIIGKQDVFYLDLDTVILRPFDALMTPHQWIMLRDFYYPATSQSGIMNITAACKKAIWTSWIKNATSYMQTYIKFPTLGDGALIAKLAPDHQQFQTLYPHCIISYKNDFLKHKMIPQTAKLMCFHGRPRPWNINVEKVLTDV